MTNKIHKLIQANSFYRNIFNLKLKDKNKITKEDSECFRPRESKGWEDGITVYDLFENPTKEDKKMFEERWINKIYSGEKIPEDLGKYLIKRGYSKEQSEYILSCVPTNVTRQKLWACENEKVGKEASLLVNASIVFGVIKEHLDFNSVPDIVKSSFNFLYGLSRGIRNYRQYYLYNRVDDDANCNRYQKDIYGNKLAGSIGSLSMIFERKINPYLFPIVELLEDKVKLPLKRLLSLPTNLWWRVRMPAHINQEFLTHFINYIFHFLPSVFGIKKSKKIIEEIKEKGNLNLSYIFKRHCKNAGIENKNEQTIKNLTKETIKNIKDLFNKDLEIQKNASERLGATIAPTLGVYGTFAMGIGSVGTGKFFNFIFQTSLVSQQFIYFPKFVIPELVEGRELKSKLSKEEELRKENYTQKEINELNRLAKKKINLAYIGAATMFFNLLSLIFKIKNQDTNNFLNKLVKTIDTAILFTEKIFAWT